MDDLLSNGFKNVSVFDLSASALAELSLRKLQIVLVRIKTPLNPVSMPFLASSIKIHDEYCGRPWKSDSDYFVCRASKNYQEDQHTLGSPKEVPSAEG